MEYVHEPVELNSNSELFNKKYTLEKESNRPVIIVGGTEINPKDYNSNIVISNVEIDGNKMFQSHEIFNDGTEGIRNSGIVVRKCKNVKILNSVIKNCRSAGICIEKGCENIVIDNCVIYGNYFDGIACYESVNCEITNCEIRDNLCAGLSFDLRFNNNIVSNCVIRNNKIGVFIRDCSDIQFFNVKILDNSEFQCYINQTNDDGSTLPEFIDFVNCVNDSKNNVNKQK